MRYNFTKAIKSGRCLVCNEAYKIGDLVCWDTVRKKLLCDNCGQEAMAEIDCSPSDRGPEVPKVKREPAKVAQADEDGGSVRLKNMQVTIDQLWARVEKLEAEVVKLKPYDFSDMRPCEPVDLFNQ